MLHLPIADVFVNPTALFLIGLFVGILGGCFGTTAQLLMVPSLSIFGLPTPFAVSTSIIASFGRSVMAIFKTDLLRYAHKRLGLSLGLFGLIGVFTGHLLLVKLVQVNLAAIVLTISYAIFLSAVAGAVFWHVIRRRKMYPGTHMPLPFWPFPQMPSPGTPKFIEFVSLAGAVTVGFCMGFATSFWGLGAGIAGTLLITRFFGAPPAVAAATDLLAMLIIGTGALCRFALSGHVEIIAGLCILAGVIIGNSIGIWLPSKLKTSIYPLAFGFLLLLAAAASILKRLEQGELAGLSLLGGAVLLCTFLILASFFNSVLPRPRPEKETNSKTPTTHPVLK